MKKRILKIASMIIVLLMMITPISAHPGRTDANGGHYCRTNCAKWGLRDGEYIIIMVEVRAVLQVQIAPHQAQVQIVDLLQQVKHKVHLK